jgi:hypothetical protein
MEIVAVELAEEEARLKRMKGRNRSYSKRVGAWMERRARFEQVYHLSPDAVYDSIPSGRP